MGETTFRDMNESYKHIDKFGATDFSEKVGYLANLFRRNEINDQEFHDLFDILCKKHWDSEGRPYPD